jgi:hypothetical protein
VSRDTTPFSPDELELLFGAAHETIVAGLAHRFDEPEDFELGVGGSALIGTAIGAAVLRANIRRLAEEVQTILRRTTSARKRERVLSADALGGQIDMGRLPTVTTFAGVWPIVRARSTRNTPENALLLVFTEATTEWAAAAGGRFRGWTGRDLYGSLAEEASELHTTLREHFGTLALETFTAVQLLPLARERVAYRQADPAVYRRAIELVGSSLPFIDPRSGSRRRIDRVLPRDTEALLGDLNSGGLPNDVFELWVASRILAAAEAQGFGVEYPYGSRQPFAIARTGSQELEMWWQTDRPIVDWPSERRWQRHRLAGDWSPLSLRPDLVLVRVDDGDKRKLFFIECKNKSAATSDSKDRAQALGYIAHYDALVCGALVYRGLGRVEVFRHSGGGAALIALAAPIEEGVEVGELLLAAIRGG